jgi:adenylate kinase
VNVVLLGAPGAGKGTQAQKIKDEFGLPHIATGDILRAAVAAGSEIGRKAKSFMDRGALVPDDVVVAIVADRITQGDCAKGWLLDGFPRTAGQAEALDATIRDRALAPIDVVVYLKVSADAVVERLSGRRVCPNTACGAAYHVKFMPPKVDGKCDRCGGAIVQRDDDKAETVKKRLDTYEKQTADLVRRYREAKTLVEISAEGAPEEVAAKVVSALRSGGGKGRGSRKRKSR